MSSLSVFFSPISITGFAPEHGFLSSQLGNVIQAYETDFPSWETDKQPQLAIVGVEEDRASINNNGTDKAPDAVRKHLYALYQGDYTMNIVDLGNIKAGNTIQDTYIALKSVVEELVKENILPIIIGGGQDLTYAQYLGYQNLERKIELAIIDARF
ncbi:MAG TPA: arginase, partial [Sphingobacterium sp.]|nr:arginase [Sphingobacterium sp.]